jgi:hypothetical protein
VKFQVEENAATPGNNLPDNVGTGGGKQLRADLEHAGNVAQLVEEIEGAWCAVDIESDYQFVFCINVHKRVSTPRGFAA